MIEYCTATPATISWLLLRKCPLTLHLVHTTFSHICKKSSTLPKSNSRKKKIENHQNFQLKSKNCGQTYFRVSFSAFRRVGFTTFAGIYNHKFNKFAIKRNGIMQNVYELSPSGKAIWSTSGGKRAGIAEICWRIRNAYLISIFFISHCIIAIELKHERSAW